MDKNDNIYKLIVEEMGEEIFVCDGDGTILFVNPASIEVNALDMQSVIGKNVKNLVEEGYFSDSSTLKVLDQRAPVSILQTLKSGKKVLATGIPVFDENGELSMVVSTSKDIDAVTDLLNQLERQEAEIESLKGELYDKTDFTASDPTTIKIKSLVDRVAGLDIPLLIFGEAGTGKKSTARAIHFAGPNKNGPLITMNCSGNSDDFIEKDLFGVEDNLPSGERKYIKKGKLEFADGGTLILNNIDALSPELQARLSEYIETGFFTRKGGDRSIHSDARVIAITAEDIKAMCEAGKFRKDLYYAINTVPIIVPPLKERPKDIPYLSKVYLSKCNTKYSSRKLLSNSALGVLSSHSWPGNLIELSQAIESAYIMTDGHVINGDTIHSIIYSLPQQGNESKVICTDIIPLKEAKKQLEEQLIKRAYQIYKTTYKAAEILEVDQSTVAKALKKYREKDKK